MPFVDIAAQNKSLDNDYGSGHGAGVPASHALALFVGDPRFGGVELVGNGYVRATILAAAWAAAVGGIKTTIAPVQFAASTGEWDEATHWALIGADGLTWDAGPLVAPLLVTAAGPGPLVWPSVYYNRDLEV